MRVNGSAVTALNKIASLLRMRNKDLTQFQVMSSCGPPWFILASVYISAMIL